MTPLETTLAFALVVALYSLWWVYRFMRLNRTEADFYRKMWREQHQFGMDIVRAINRKADTQTPTNESASQGAQEAV